MIKLVGGSVIALLGLWLAQPAATPAAAPAESTVQAAHCTFWYCDITDHEYPSRFPCEAKCGGPGTCSAFEVC